MPPEPSVAPTPTPTPVPENSAPVANAGADQGAHMGDVVSLDGSASTDADGDELSYSWTIVGASIDEGITLINAEAVMPEVQVHARGSYEIMLIVNDGIEDSEADYVSIEAGNVRPVADAGADQSDEVGTTFALDGSGSSDVDGDALTYFWAVVEGPDGAALTNANTVAPSFTPSVMGEYTIQLIVNDGIDDSDLDFVSISVNEVVNPNRKPIANAGADQSSFVGQSVRLDGSNSRDPDGDALTYRWSVSSVPAGSMASVSDAGAMKPQVEIDVAGTYVMQLIVSDGLLQSDPDTVVINTQNTRPVADAGNDATVDSGASVQLDGSDSYDADGDALTFSWSIVSQPAAGEHFAFKPFKYDPKLYGSRRRDLCSSTNR